MLHHRSTNGIKYCWEVFHKQTQLQNIRKGNFYFLKFSDSYTIVSLGTDYPIQTTTQQFFLSPQALENLVNLHQADKVPLCFKMWNWELRPTERGWGLYCVYLSVHCCYHQKQDFEICKFKSFNYPSVFLLHYNFSTFGPAWWYWD